MAAAGILTIAFVGTRMAYSDEPWYNVALGFVNGGAMVDYIGHLLGMGKILVSLILAMLCMFLIEIILILLLMRCVMLHKWKKKDVDIFIFINIYQKMEVLVLMALGIKAIPMK